MRYIIVEKTKGIFLGNYIDVSLFSNDLVLPVVKAYSFPSIEDAQDVMKFLEGTDSDYSVKEINYDGKYIPIDILIKSGYSDYTERMLRYLSPPTNTIH